MKKLLLCSINLLFTTFLLAQDTDLTDRVNIEQNNQKFMGVFSYAYQDLQPNGFSLFQLHNYGGTPAAPLATPGGKILGAFMFSGYDGSAKKQLAELRVSTLSGFTPMNTPVRMDFIVGPDRLKRISILGDSGFVGVGTSVPTTEFDVQGNIRMRTGATTGYIPVSNAEGVMTWTDPSSIFTPSPWTLNGTDTYFDNGAVGIGTTTPITKLHVFNGASSQTGTTNPFVDVLIEGGNNSYMELKGENFAGLTFHANNQSLYAGLIYDYGNNGILIKSGGSNSMRITESGNIGIGTPSTPTHKLDVNGNIRMRNGATDGYIPISNADGVMTWTDPINVFTPSQWIANGVDTYFDTGNVGIGTQNPNNKLDVNSNGAVTVGVNANANNGTNIRTAALVLKTNATLDDELFIKKYGSGETSTLSNGLSLANMSVIAPSADAGALYTGTQGNHPLYLATNDEVAMYINAFQDIGVNTQSPGAQMHVLEEDGTNIYVIQGESTYTGNSSRYGVYGKSINNPGYGYGGYFRGGSRGIYASAEASSYSVISYGVQGYASGTAGARYGVHGNAFNAGGVSGYGVYGTATGSANNNFGIYGTASNGGTNWAGYFAGDVRVTGTLDNTSDARLKKDIKEMEGALDIIKQLQPKTYTFRTNEYPHMMLDKRPQLGFVAQDMEKVLPQLVRTATHPEFVNEEGKEIGKPNSPAVEVKAINYIGIIPVLTQGIKELTVEVEEKNEVIEELKSEVETVSKDNAELKSELVEIKNQMATMMDDMNDKFNQMEEDMSSCCLNEENTKIGSTNMIELNGKDVAFLEQNSPNPFYEQTVIKYYIPSSSRSAAMTITDIKGAPLKSMNLEETGLGTVTINANELPIGTYIYTLFIDGRQIESRQMILVK